MGRRFGAAVGLALVLLVPAAANAETCDAPGQVPPIRQCDTRPPHAEFKDIARDDSGAKVTFRSTSTANPDRKLVREEWDFDGDGKFDASGREVEHVYTAPGTYSVTLHVIDDHGVPDTATGSWWVRAPGPQSVELTAEAVDLYWPNMVRLHGRVLPIEAGVKEIYLHIVARRPDSSAPTALTVPVAADGTFSFIQRLAGNATFTAEARNPTSGGDGVMSTPVDVFVDWRAQWGWHQIRGSLVEAGFVVRPVDASGPLTGHLFYLYWHRPGGKWMRRVAHGRVRVSRTSHAVGYSRFHVRRPGKRDRVFFCIRGAGSDGWGRPSSAYDLGCGLPKLRL